ncbi:MAG TPA: hypothetical protein VEY06_15150 [Flavisolibacter sp.]|nr:hypothetical protein [Flavisolibacter sp.]
MQHAKASSAGKKDFKGQSYSGVTKSFEKPVNQVGRVQYRYTFHVTGKVLRENDLYERQNS